MLLQIAASVAVLLRTAEFVGYSVSCSAHNKELPYLPVCIVYSYTDGSGT